MTNPLVSILINNYNYRQFLSEAIESALNQTYRNIEVVVVDDGSTDDSREVLAQYDGRIVTVLKRNGGQASAFNAGFQASRGEIVCFLDADDWFAPDKVATVVATFACNPGSGWLVHHLRHVDNEHKSISILELANFTPPPVVSGNYTRIAKFGRDRNLPWLPATTGLCFRRAVLEKILPVPLALRITADNYLKCAGLMTSPLLAVEKVLAFQRIHGSNAYSNIDRQDKKFRKASRGITRHISRGLYSLERNQWYSSRLVLRSLKMSLKDLDFIDTAVSVKDLLFFFVMGSISKCTR